VHPKPGSISPLASSVAGSGTAAVLVTVILTIRVAEPCVREIQEYVREGKRRHAGRQRLKLNIRQDAVTRGGCQYLHYVLLSSFEKLQLIRLTAFTLYRITSLYFKFATCLLLNNHNYNFKSGKAPVKYAVHEKSQ
jgi:hypothetical protein